MLSTFHKDLLRPVSQCQPSQLSRIFGLHASRSYREEESISIGAEDHLHVILVDEGAMFSQVVQRLTISAASLHIRHIGTPDQLRRSQPLV